MGQKITDLANAQPSAADLLLYTHDPTGTPVSKSTSVTQLATALIGTSAGYSLKNNSGATVSAGNVVCNDSSMDNAFLTTSKGGDLSVIGVVLDASILNGSFGNIVNNIKIPVMVDGNVTRGHWLINSATNVGMAHDSGTFQRPSLGAIGYALASYAGAAGGTVSTYVNINVYASTTTLLKLPTSLYIASTGGLFTMDSGADLLVVRFTGNAAAAGVTYNTLALTQISQTSFTTPYVSIWALKNPPIGSYALAWTGAAHAFVTDYVGSQVTPFRTPSTNGLNNQASIACAPVSAVGDIVIDVVAATTTGYSCAGTQTSENVIDFGGESTKAGAAGTTTMTWNGSGQYECMCAVAIAGS